MSQPEAGPSAPADSATDFQASKVKIQQINKAAQQDKTADNRSKAKQNKERAAQNRARKAQNVSFAGDKDLNLAASSTAPKQPKKQPKKEASKAQQARQANAGPTQFKSKVVIRRLPPNLPEDIFWKAVSHWIRDSADCKAPADTTPAQSKPSHVEARTSSTTPTSSAALEVSPTVDFKQFIAGKLKTDANKSNKYARAYVRFLDPQSLVEFHRAFDGHIFRDSRGKESVAIVEFAPYQRVIPPASANGARNRRARPDQKQGTIEKDADYLSFVERLNQATDDVKRSEGDLLASLHDPKGKEKEREAKNAAGKATPLLQHLRAVKLAKMESAAAIKKAKRQEKAAAKAAAAKGGPANGAAAVTASASLSEEKSQKKNKKKDKKKDKGKGKAAAVSATGEGAKAEEGAKDGAVKKKNNKKKGKGKATADSAEKGEQQAKVAANKKPEAKVDTATEAANTQTDGAAKPKPKPKPKPPRGKGGGSKSKDKPAAAPASNAPSQPANVQIIKRD